MSTTPIYIFNNYSVLVTVHGGTQGAQEPHYHLFPPETTGFIPPACRRLGRKVDTPPTAESSFSLCRGLLYAYSQSLVSM